MERIRRHPIVYVIALVAAFPLFGMSCAFAFLPYAGPADAPKLYVGGDSITYQSIDNLNAQFQPAYQVRIDAWSGAATRHMAPKVMAAAASAPKVAVIELGTNDPFPLYNIPLDESKAHLQAMNASFPPATCVVFVTPWSGTAQRPAGALAAIAAFERATFSRIADWDVAATPDDYVGGDGVHPNSAGRLHLIQVEAAAIATC